MFQMEPISATLLVHRQLLPAESDSEKTEFPSKKLAAIYLSGTLFPLFFPV